MRDNNGQVRIVLARSNGVDPDSRVEKEANTLVKNGFKVTILAWDRSKNYWIREDKKVLSGTEVKRVSFGAKAGFGEGMKSLIPFSGFQIRLFLWLVKNRNKYDIAHLCDFDTAFFGCMAAKLCKKIIVFDIFDYLSTDAKGIINKIVKFFEDGVINRADATIICTEERRKQIKGTHPHRLTIIHNTPEAIENIKIGPRLIPTKKNNEITKIAYIGILQDYRLIKEMIHAVEKMQNVELHIGGFGKYESYIKHEAEKHENVMYYGKLQYRDTLALENECDIMTAIYDPAIGNHRYAAPNKFYEALMLGKPLIMVKGTGMSRVVIDNDIGELIDYDEDSFRKGVEKIISRKNEWDNMSLRMRRLYNDRYSWKKMEKRLINLYKNLENDYL